ncbi:aldose 1-epimerase [Polaribacter sp. Hel1_33_78]|jgi:aldose 1-epimerase|uniref:aldose 1-epimerase n=1 Tax=Polaribacter sp. Hel1_33_78 TaxID=1336804 RepID=UPI00087ADFE8|nr:aldose 1-epimerase [Polaribacter sp. Hel1_33_78]SDT96194.1 aldose 1-epimerase [Polaribacter sp. Hel1_33_78]
MFTIQSTTEEGLPIIILQNKSNTTSAKISLNEGGRLKDLKIKTITLIKEIPEFDYSTSYASSILFPFVGRMAEGKYSYQNKEYQLNCNENSNNTLHGLVYNKKFNVVKETKNVNCASVIINYEETNENLGFPYKFNLQLTYTLFENEIRLSVMIKNIDHKTFPFTLGWHPYFFCDKLSRSTLEFESNQKIKFNENLITEKVIAHKTEKYFKIKDQQLDDCFILNANTINFLTPDHHIEISSNQSENYLQLYTPKDLPLIAIEPMTGVSNSFNNNIGLQQLAPNQKHSTTWNVKLNS